MANTYVAITTTTVGAGGASTIILSSIPQTYTDLCLVVSTRTTAASTSGNDFISFNGSSASFSGCRLYGTGGSYGGDTVTNWVGFNSANNGTTSTFSNSSIYIPNYTSANNKSYSVDTVQEQNGTTAFSGLSAGLWSNTSAITSITLTPDSGNYAQYSTATLYGIKNS